MSFSFSRVNRDFDSSARNLQAPEQKDPGGYRDALIRIVHLSVSTTLPPQTHPTRWSSSSPGRQSTTWSLHCRISPSLSSGNRLAAVYTRLFQPLSVRLDLHGAPAEAVSVHEEMASFLLNVLPVVGTRGRCERKNKGRYNLTVATPLNEYVSKIWSKH